MQGERAVGLADELGVAPLGVGAWAWGTTRLWGYGKDYDRRDVGEAFRASIAAGVTLFDTAEIYGNGASERIIGEILHEGGFDGTPAIATKFAPLPYRLGARSLLDALDKSLVRFGVATVDLYQIHFPNPLFKIESLMDVLAEAVKEGKIRHVGVSNYSAEQMKRAHDRLASHDIALASNQVEYSLLQRAPETNGVLDTCRDLGVTLIAYSPIAQGLLTGKYAPGSKPSGLVRRFGKSFGEKNLKKIEPVIDILREIGAAHDKEPAQVALNWLITRRSTLPIPGAKNERQARQNAGALGWEMTDEEAKKLELATLGWR
ncbi:MAG TPA: aldo/keto reductase [Rubrobacteraceae bacterium]|nr:aldo/keto reductase [Rubrobacteraceae bacterium]